MESEEITYTPWTRSVTVDTLLRENGCLELYFLVWWMRAFHLTGTGL